MATGQLPLDGGKGTDRPPPTPTEQRRLLVNGAADFNRKFPPGPGEPKTAEEQVDDALARGVVSLHTQEALLDHHDAVEQDATAPLVRGDITHVISAGPDGLKVTNSGPDEPRELVWVVPHQAQIECRALTDGGVEIWQDGQHGPDEAQTIHVGSGNAVKLARMLLWAAGFEHVGIYTAVKGGNVDVDDGDTAESVYSENPRRT